MGDLKEPDSDIPHAKFPSFLKRADEIQNQSIANLGRRMFMIIQQSRSITIGRHARGCEIKTALEKEKEHDGKVKGK